MTDPTLVILAAGMGSRYGGLKQMDGVGPNGEAIIDYSVYDAIRAGFKKVVFVIREEFAAEFKEKVSNKFSSAIEVVHVYQSLDTGFVHLPRPEERMKPWGTGHALLVAKDVVHEPFAVINADDYYGQDAFVQAQSFLSGLEDDELAGMVGFPLENTLSDHGHVNRGICELDEDYFLKHVIEREKIVRKDGRIEFQDDEGSHQELDADSVASMNFWLFHPKLFIELSERFEVFLEDHRSTPKSEFYIPFFVDELIQEDMLQVLVMSSNDAWLGVTYKEDRAIVEKAMIALHAESRYPKKLNFES